MTATLLGAAAPYCCSRLMPVRYLSSPSSVLRSNSQGSLPYGTSLHCGTCVSSLWRGLKHHGPSFPSNHNKMGKKGKSRCMIVYASLFGVGAPEALVIGVVALLIFGPKGLAEVARNLGKTLRAFQPTIRELQEVSREFKSTLEREIGLDDIPSSSNNTYRSNSFFNENQHTTSEPIVKPTTESPVAATTNMDRMNLLEEQTQESPPASMANLDPKDKPEEIKSVELLSPALEVSKFASTEIKSHTPTSSSSSGGSD